MPLPRSTRLLLLLLLALLLAPPARAHDPALSGLRVIVSKESTLVSVTTHLSRLAEAEGVTGKLEPDQVDPAIRRRLQLRFGGQPVELGRATVLPDEASDLVVWQVRVPERAERVEVLQRLYPEDPTSRFVVSIQRDGQGTEDLVLDTYTPSLVEGVDGAPRWPRVAAHYFHEGILHIFGGIDHVLFVLGLLLLGGTLKGLMWTVTSFTLAHSLTLSIAATGLWSPSPRLVEPIIALSIAVIAGENLLALRRGKHRDLRPYFAFGFGLLHGFGFAGALAELGLPPDSIAVALATFNLGVETGQAAIVLVVAPLLALLARKQEKAHRAVVALASVGIGAAGLFWFVERLVGSG